MAYEKQQWDTTSFVNPTRMNHIEEGIKANSDEVASLNNDLANTKKDVSDLNSNLTQTNQSLGEYKFLPRYDAVIGTMTSPSQEYTCGCNCFLIGTIKGAPDGWASVRSAHNTNYFLALETTQNETAICIPFKKGDKIFLGSTGIYNLGVARAD